MTPGNGVSGICGRGTRYGVVVMAVSPANTAAVTAPVMERWCDSDAAKAVSMYG